MTSQWFIGLFRSDERAEHAITALKNAGFAEQHTYLIQGQRDQKPIPHATMVDGIALFQHIGLPAYRAKAYQNALHRGSTLVIVATDTAHESQAMNLLRQFADEGVQDWQANHLQPPSVTDLSFSAPVRSPSSTLDYGVGADSFLPGKDMADYDRSQTEMDHYLQRDPDAWRAYEEQFREHYNRTYAGMYLDTRWEDFQDAYEFGFQWGQESRFAETTWEEARPYLIQNWEMRHMGQNWATHFSAVRLAWEIGRKAAADQAAQ